MTQLKFRAWNKKNKQWIPTYQLLMNNEGKLCCCYSDKNHGEWAIDYEVNLSTGLFDQKGKEVFEGDIVSAKMGEQEGEDFWEVKEIIYCGKGGFNLGGHNMQDIHYDCDNGRMEWLKWLNSGHGAISNTYWELKEFEVIGNIYENPNLLK